MTVEISIDDGHYKDVMARELLDEFGLKATFFIPSIPCSLTLDTIRALDKDGHTIGGHTVSHPSDMKLLSAADQLFQIERNKNDLEFLIGHSIDQFCYPRGRYNGTTIMAATKVGYKSARTTVVGASSLGFNPFAKPTSVHIYPRAEYNGVPITEYAKHLFDAAGHNKDDGYFHVWFHSWEVDKLDLWDDVRKIFQMIKGSQ